MADSYPRRDQARGIWKIGDITKNIKGDGTYPQLGGGTIGLCGGGEDASKKNAIEKIIIETAGNATDFGDLTSSRRQSHGCGSFVRCVWGGGDTGSNVNTMDYVHFHSDGNAADFGDLSQTRRNVSTCNNDTRGIWAEGETPSY